MSLEILRNKKKEQMQADNAVWKIAKNLYKAIWSHYMFQISCIGPDDYAHMQSEIGYLETYEQHMKQLVSGIPHDTRVMVQQIAQFITEYVEFQDPKYIQKIHDVAQIMQANRIVYKKKAFDILVQQNAGKDPELSTSCPHPPIFEMDMGGQKIVLPTYCNPMLTALYSLLFMCFVHFQQSEPINSY